MAKPDAKKFPKLKEAWDEYGHCIAWDKLFDIKLKYWMGSSGGLACLAWKHEDGMIEYAEMELVGGVWEMNNDGGEAITLKQWQAATIPDECNWLSVPDAVK